MAEDFEQFARECKALSRALSALPRELRKEMSREVLDKVADPLAQKVGHAARGPFRRALFGANKVRANPNPTIVVGGRTGTTLSGGATARDVVWGTEFGGGNRVSVVNREVTGGRKRAGRIGRGEFARQKAAGRTIYKRHTTRQFNPATPYIYPTVEKQLPWVLDTYAEIVLKHINDALDV